MLLAEKIETHEELEFCRELGSITKGLPMRLSHRPRVALRQHRGPRGEIDYRQKQASMIPLRLWYHLGEGPQNFGRHVGDAMTKTSWCWWVCFAAPDDLSKFTKRSFATPDG